jgi:tetratricopeptide (TPR) repeat protein
MVGTPRCGVRSAQRADPTKMKIMNETPTSKRGWRILRRILIVLAILATLVALLYAEEDWRGKRAWENFQREWEAKGEKFDWQAFVPPSGPGDQNFFTAPVFTNMRNSKIEMSSYGYDSGPDFRPDARRSGYAIYRMQMTDLQVWQNYYRHQTNADMAKRFPVTPQTQTPAADVLFALSKFDSAVEELREASQRPYASVPLNYEDGFDSVSSLLPVLAELKRCSQVLQLRAAAELADGQSGKALEDVKLFLYLNNSLRSSPFLISHLVRMAIANMALQPIWEGLAEHKWSDEQLVALDAELAKMDFLADYEFAMRGERAFAIASFENQRRTRESISGFVTVQGNSELVTNKLTLMPSAYFDQNELTFARMHQQWILPLVDTNSRTVSPAALEHAEKSVQAGLKHYSPYNVQALMLFPAIGSAVKKFAAIQASIDLARVACALERYRLANGVYPETLDALAPQFIGKLPHDIINGQPLHYRRTDDGKFVLYSVGWNETDDGGTVVFLKGGVTVDRDKGDWVWKY